MRRHSSASKRWRAAGIRLSVSAPNPTRARVTTPGSKWSRPMAINRNDAPQVPEMNATSAQSKELNDSSVSPSDVVSRRLPAVIG